MRKRIFGRNDGFTLIEMAIVAAISGLAISIALLVYRSYMNDRFANESYDKLRIVDSSLAFFISTANRLPCPSNPTIPVDDPNAGQEIPIASCQWLRGPLASAGDCLDGVCRVDGFRDTDADGDVDLDPVLIGGLPFRIFRDKSAANEDYGSTSSLTQRQSLDPWGYQFTYAVSGYLTDAVTYNSAFGAIDVRTEPTAGTPAGSPVVDPEGSSQYVVIAHGKNHLGAYSSQGVIGIPCIAGATQDAENCDRTGNATFIAGLMRETGDANYFDDILIYNSYALSTLWDFVGTTTDIYNRNPGFVGIGTGAPEQELHVVGDIRSDSATTSAICSRIGTGCWSPDILAAPASSGLTLFCPDTGTVGFADVIVGIEIDPVTNQPRATCGLAPKLTPQPNQQCGPGTYVTGIGPSGVIICGLP